MGPWKTGEPSPEKRFGFKFFNTGPATIMGAEINLAGQGKISRHVSYQINCGYTYSLPQAKDPDYVYTSTLNLDYTYRNSAFNPDNNILKYRIQHVGKADLNITFIKRFTVGFSAKYFSQMKNVDRVFFDLDHSSPNPAPWLEYYNLDLPFNGIYNFMQRTKNGSWVFDFRFAFELDKLTLSALVTNFLNKEYSLRPLHVEPPRLMTLALNYRFADINPGKFFRQKQYKN